MFQIISKLNKGGSFGRAGVLSTENGQILTPAFVAVGTKGTVKSLTPENLWQCGSQVVLANTYHLHLEPGEEVVRDNGGLGRFMHWSGPTMTDSGGFQAFSLGVAYGHGLGKFIQSDVPPEEILSQIKETDTLVNNKSAKVTEKGVEFNSFLDGSKRFLSPEKSIQIQRCIGADIIFVLDEFTSPHAEHEKIKSTIDRTFRWAGRCLDEFRNTNNESLKSKTRQFLFGIVQGGRFEDLRKESARQISSLPFDGFGIGGTFVKEDMATAVAWVNSVLPEEKPRHLLGVGEPTDLFLGVENGCDTFDCVAPTRMARNGSLYTAQGKININNSKYKTEHTKIDQSCNCYTCTNYTASYLAHLFRAKEMLGATLASIHNLYFLNNMMSQIRQSIIDDTFFDLKEKFFAQYKG